MQQAVDRIGTVGTAVVVVVVLAMAAITERVVLTGAVPGAAAAGSPSGRAAGGRGPAARQKQDPGSTATPPARLPPDLDLLDGSVRRVTLAVRGARSTALFGVKAGKPIVTTNRLTRDNAWAIGSSTIPVPASGAVPDSGTTPTSDASPDPVSGTAGANGDRGDGTSPRNPDMIGPGRGGVELPQASLFLANWTGTRWQVALSGTAQFRTLLRRAPRALLSAGERGDLGRFGLGADTALALPWETGQTRKVLHIGDVLAFQGGDGKVLAAADGRVYHVCGGMLLVVHASGPATEYYGLSKPTGAADGTKVKAGDVLGETGTNRPCGGGPGSGTIFGLTGTNGQISLIGRSVGGWTFRSESGTDWAARGPLSVLVGGALTNLGPGGSGAPLQPTPAPTQERPPASPSPNGDDRSSGSASPTQ
jgi:hypothetical protein